MKKMFKKMAVMVSVVAMAVSATVIPTSASSVSGAIDSTTSCGGSNSITSTGASARTWASRSVTLRVKVYYNYLNALGTEGKTISNTNANNPVSSISTSISKPSSSFRSYRCYSTHTAIYNGTWERNTDWQKY